MLIIFSLTFLVSVGLLALGLLSPSFLKPLVRGLWSRTRIAAVFGAAIFFSFVGAGLTAPAVPDEVTPAAIVTPAKVAVPEEKAAVAGSVLQIQNDASQAKTPPATVAPPSTVTDSATTSSTNSTTSATSTTPSTYKNVDGQTIESPSANTNGATGVCNDGTYTHATHHQGACSHHGGVSYWL